MNLGEFIEGTLCEVRTVESLREGDYILVGHHGEILDVWHVTRVEIEGGIVRVWVHKLRHNEDDHFEREGDSLVVVADKKEGE